MTDTVIAMAIAAGIGFGLVVALRGLRRRPIDLATLVAERQEARPATTWAVSELDATSPTISDRSSATSAGPGSASSRPSAWPIGACYASSSGYSTSPSSATPTRRCSPG